MRGARPTEPIATARSSSSSLPTRRCCRTSWSAWRGACRWASRGLACRVNGSGDIFIAFSTGNPGAAAETGVAPLAWLPNGDLTPFFEATIQATEEAIVNALVAAETMVGINGNTVPALPTDQLRAILTKYNRLNR